MAPLSFLSLFILFCLLLPFVSSQEPSLSVLERESVYTILESINPSLPWRTIYPDDPCYSAPHGVVCDVFPPSDTLHVTELSFGFVSDYSPNPQCSTNSTLILPSLSSLSKVRKLFFYKCFTDKPVVLPDLSSFGSSIEELVFIENPSLVGSIGGNFGNLTSLRRVVLSGSNVSGEIPDGFGDLVSVEEISLPRNKLRGKIPLSLLKLKNLKVLDLSQNGFEGDLPESLGGLAEILKIDFSYNNFSGKIPESLSKLGKIEFMDLSYNRFGNFGVPLFLSEMKSLREVYLSGNMLGGQIPEIWEGLGCILGIGLSGTGLVGNIPASMGVFLRNACYIGLDNNRLEGPVPKEFGSMGSVLELNLENNRLMGRVPFSAHFVSRIGEKLKLQGNPQLCVDEGLRAGNVKGSLGKLQLCKESFSASAVSSVGSSFGLQASHPLLFLGFLLFLL